MASPTETEAPDTPNLSPPVQVRRTSGWALLGAALRGRCPQCGQGRIFHGRFAMHVYCPVCGLKFEREQGYFLGAMYFSYFLSVPLIGAALLLLSWLLPELAWEVRVGLSGVALLPFVPVLFRYSRVLWIHFDRWVSPRQE